RGTEPARGGRVGAHRQLDAPADAGALDGRLAEVEDIVVLERADVAHRLEFVGVARLDAHARAPGCKGGVGVKRRAEVKDIALGYQASVGTSLQATATHGSASTEDRQRRHLEVTR